MQNSKRSLKFFTYFIPGVLFFLFLIDSASAVTLGISGNRFTLNGQPKFLVLSGYWDGLDASNPSADLNWLKSKGFDGIRIFPNLWDYCPNCSQRYTPSSNTVCFSHFTFMNNQTYEQYELKAEVIGDFAKYLKEGQSIYILLHDGQALSIRPPHTVKLKVIEAHDAVKGDTASGAKKIVKLETGVTISVPLFIKKGDIISVNPETGEYLERTS